jgi:hypothetical protein
VEKDRSNSAGIQFLSKLHSSTTFSPPFMHLVPMATSFLTPIYSKIKMWIFGMPLAVRSHGFVHRAAICVGTWKQHVSISAAWTFNHKPSPIMYNVSASPINPLTPELNPSAHAAWRDFLLGILFLEPCILLICAWKTNKCTNYSLSLLIMYGSFYMFQHYIAIFRKLS